MAMAIVFITITYISCIPNIEKNNNMANCCSCQYTIIGEAAPVMYKQLVSHKENNESNWDWIGHFIQDIGKDPETIDCRGWIQDYHFDEDDKILELYCETAWNEKSAWRHFITSTYPDTQVYYTAEEPGMELYLTNDPSFEYWYKLEVEYYDGGEYEFKTAEELLREVCKIVGCEVPIFCDDDTAYILALEIAEDFNNEHEDEDVYIYVHEFQFCNN